MSLENKKVEIKVQGAKTIPYSDLVPFQGDLKKLTMENYLRLRDEILRDGFCEPVTVWLRAGKYIILNGHQRIATIKEMVETEGFECPDLPVSVVQGITEEQANDLVLALTSQFGEMSNESLAKFISDRSMRVKTVFERFRHPEIEEGKVIKMVDEAVRVAGGGEGGGESTEEDEVPEPPKVPRSKRGELYFLDPYYECDTCGKVYPYEEGKHLSECKCG